jgi:ribosomal protein S6 kinase alpha-5
MAPEIVETSDAGYDMAVDWWSLGVATYELLTRKLPFKCRSKPETAENMAWQIITAEPHIPNYLSSDAADFISKLLVKDPRKRLGGGKDDAEELKRHPFLKGIKWSELIQKKIRAPFVPRKIIELDVSNVADESTQIIPSDLSVTRPPKSDKIFRGYSYVSPSVHCSEYVVRGELFQPPAELPALSRSLILPI